MATQPTYNYEAEQAALLRQMKIAEAMQAAGMQGATPTEMVSGVAVRKSPLEGLAKVAQAYMGAKGIQDTQAKQKALGERYAADGKAGVQSLIEGLSVQPGEQAMPAGVMGPGENLTPQAAQGAKRKAVLEAVMSNHPVLKELGMVELKRLNEKPAGALTPKDLFDKASPDAQEAMARGGDPGQVFKALRAKPIEVGGMLVDPETKQIIKINGAPPERVTIAGDLYEVNPSTMQLKKLDNATKVTTNVNAPTTVISKGQIAGAEEWSKQAARVVTDLADKARASTKMLTSMNELEGLTKAGTVAGPLADAAVFMSGLAKQAGIPVDASKLANSQTFDSESTKMWADMMNSMGGARGLVKEESEKIARALPNLVQTPQGRGQIIALMRKAAEQQIQDAQKASAEYNDAITTQDFRKFTFGLSNTQLPQTPPRGATPGASAPAGAGVLTLDQYLQQKRR